MKFELFRQLAEPRGERIAAIDDQGQTIIYAELQKRAAILAGQIGAEKQLVLLEGGLTIGWLIAYVACLIGNHACLLAPVNAPQIFDRLASTFRPGITMREIDGYAPRPRPDGVRSIHPDLCVLLSTSGSTGSAKCVRLSHQNIAANAASIAEYLEIGQDEKGVVSLPTHYSYGLSIVNSHLHAGATLLMTARSMVDPDFWQFCRDHGATSFAGVPHNYDLLERVGLEKVAPPSLRYFTQAGGKLQKALVEKFSRLAQSQGWKFYVMYGQTEASPRMAYLPPEQALLYPDSIGVPVPGGSIDILNEQGTRVPEGVQGEMVYRGPNVMMGYAVSPDELGLPAQLDELRTGDIAFRDTQGLFYIVGRLSRFIKIFGNRIGLDEVERMGAEAGIPCIATGIDGHLLAVTRDAQGGKLLAGRLAEALKLPISAIEVRVVQDYPLLPSGKIDYATLKSSIAPSGSAPASQEKGEAGINRIFATAFGKDLLDDKQSFTSLGGDSLHYVQISLEIESVVGFLPAGWEDLSIAELKRLSVESQGASNTKTQSRGIRVDVLRGITAVLVVLHHVTLSIKAYYPLDMMPRWPNHLDWVFQNFRMPTFFLCSGLVYAASAKKGVKWFLLNRFDFFLWIILVWTGFQLFFESFGVNLYPWAPLPEDGKIFYFVYSPKGALWFIYSIFILSGYASLTSRLSRPVQVGLALFFSYASYQMAEHVSPDYALLLTELGRYGFPMFVIGVVFKRELVALFESTKSLVWIAFLGAAIFLSVSFARVESIPVLFSKTLPATFSFISFVIIMCRFERFKRVFGSVGAWSFEVFLTHLFIIGMIYYALGLLEWRPKWYFLWMPVFLLTMSGSLLAGRALARVPENLFFRVPNFQMFKMRWAASRTRGR